MLIKDDVRAISSRDVKKGDSVTDVTWNDFKKELCGDFDGCALNWGYAPNPFKYRSSFVLRKVSS
jgi:hypothetical protein